MTATYLEELVATVPVRTGSEPEWLVNLRRDAWDRFSKIGFPTTRNEDWRFTSVAPISQATFGQASPLAKRDRPSRADRRVTTCRHHGTGVRERLPAFPRCRISRAPA